MYDIYVFGGYVQTWSETKNLSKKICTTVFFQFRDFVANAFFQFPDLVADGACKYVGRYVGR